MCDKSCLQENEIDIEKILNFDFYRYNRQLLTKYESNILFNNLCPIFPDSVEYIHLNLESC